MARAAPGADRHSRVVGLAKVALPLGGLGLLSGLFLLAGGGERPSPPLAPQARGVAAEQRLSAPVHAGVTARGDAVELSAAFARPDPLDPRRMEAEDLRARVATARGATLDLRAPEGRVDTAAGRATLAGGLRLRATGGESGPIEAEADGMAFDLRRARAESAGPVRAEAPMGTLEAGAMLVEGDRVEFASGVRLRLARPAAP